MSLTAGVLIARTAAHLLARERDQALIGLTTRIGQLVQQTIAERQHEVQVLASIPELVSRAREASAAPPDGHGGSRVARGNLALTPAARHGQDDEVGRLVRSTTVMIDALRQLVGAVQSAALEATDLAQSTASATEQIVASTEEVAATASELNDRARRQAELIRAVADDAAAILAITQTLAREASEAAGRGDALASASQEIEQFVTLIRQVADQTHLLSLNASIEAARAGEQGHGFTVVAHEVRRLADRARESSELTERTVRAVRHQVELARDRLLRLAKGGLAARDTADRASGSLALIAHKATANGEWGQRVSDAAARVERLLVEIASRTTEASVSTDETMGASTQIAAATEELQASAEMIASSASTLSVAAERLSGTAQQFRLPHGSAGLQRLDLPSSTNGEMLFR